MLQRVLIGWMNCGRRLHWFSGIVTFQMVDTDRARFLPLPLLFEKQVYVANDEL
jgi:hypothetical protein